MSHHSTRILEGSTASQIDASSVANSVSSTPPIEPEVSIATTNSPTDSFSKDGIYISFATMRLLNLRHVNSSEPRVDEVTNSRSASFQSTLGSSNSPICLGIFAPMRPARIPPSRNALSIASDSCACSAGDISLAPKSCSSVVVTVDSLPLILILMLWLCPCPSSPSLPPPPDSDIDILG